VAHHPGHRLGERVLDQPDDGRLPPELGWFEIAGCGSRRSQRPDQLGHRRLGPAAGGHKCAHGSVQQILVRLIITDELYLDFTELAGAPMPLVNRHDVVDHLSYWSSSLVAQCDGGAIGAQLGNLLQRSRSQVATSRSWACAGTVLAGHSKTSSRRTRAEAA
jgi:hypothetical protein